MKTKLNRNSGLTLIEVIVSTALLAILSIMLVTIMAVATTAIKTTRERTSHAMAAAGQIEENKAEGSQSPASSTTGHLTITFGGNRYDVSGSYVFGVDGGVKYYEFVPD